MIKKSNILVVLLVAVALLCGTRAQAMEILSSAELVPGMRGYAKTVIEGTDIETFELEIIGVLRDNTDNEGKIIARASGALIEKTGGVLQGMSGSPVYIDGKLIGAVAGGWKDVDNRMCLLTPIGDMLKVWDLPDNKNEAQIKQANVKAKIKKITEDDKLKQKDSDATTKSGEKKNATLSKDTDQKAGESSSATSKSVKADKAKAGKAEEVSQADKADKADKAKAGKAKKVSPADGATKADKSEGKTPEKEATQQPLMTPLMVSGFGDAGLAFLQEKLAPYQMMPYASGSGSGVAQGSDAALEAGSAIGVQIVRGDMSMAAIGTVTAVENGKVLAFGHPFLRKGNVNYFMTDAEIIGTASGQTSGFKIGMPGRTVGRINQDRSAAIAGILGSYPAVVPLKVQVEDVQLGRKKAYHMQIAYDEELLPTVAAAMTYNAMDLARDRLGSGTARVEFEIMTNSALNGKFVRDNLFYNVQDVGQIAISELLQTVNLLATNSMEESDIVGIKVNVRLNEERKTASIIEVMPDRVSVKAGESVNLKIKLKPYRKPERVMVVPYKVPKHQPPGIVNMEARGGGMIPLIQVLLQQQGIDLSAEEDKMKPLSAKLDELAKSNKNNEIVIGIAPMLPEQMAETGKAAKPKKTAKEPSKEVNEATAKPNKSAKSSDPTIKRATEYVIDNARQFVLQIE